MLGFSRAQAIGLAAMAALIIAAPGMLYPVFLMKVLCFALFACAFNLLIGYLGLLSFGHAAYFGMGSYVSAWVAKNWGLSAELCILLGGLTGAALGAAFSFVIMMFNLPVPGGYYCVLFPSRSRYLAGNGLLRYYFIPASRIDGRVVLRYYPSWRSF